VKVLVLTPYLPHRQVGHGGGTAVRDLVRNLAQQHEVLVASLVRPGEEDLVHQVEELGVQVASLPFVDRGAEGEQRSRLFLDRLAAAGRSLISGYPYYVEKYWNSTLRRRLLDTVQAFNPDAIQIEYLQMSLLARDLRRWRTAQAQADPRLIINSHELGSLPRQRRARRANNPVAKGWALLEARAWKKLQVDASRWSDSMLCVTPGDRSLFAAMGGRNLEMVPLGMDTEVIKPDWAPASCDRFLFVGSFAHRPNRLAAEFLIHRLWPKLVTEIPEGRLVLAGRGSIEFLNESGGMEFWAGQGVDALGFVEDLAPHFRQSRLFLAPLPEGGGIKIKILEAMARGIPIVTTPVGSEGISEDSDEAISIAECDDSFVDAVLAAYRDPGARQQAARARRLIEEKFSWTAIVNRLTEIYARPGRSS
jgi:glycosyltransferase involved in cell wall biosynthesis